MGLIPKIVLTPVKWASKELLHRTLLRFPGGDSHDAIACTYCPEMCRFSCPTAVASGNDAVTPCNKNSLLHKEKRWPGRSAAGGELWPIYDCTGCGRCTEYCVYGVPVAESLLAARKVYGWERAREVAADLKDADDPVGDLADELGDGGTATKRLDSALSRSEGKVLELDEPQSVFFAGISGASAALSWQGLLLAADGDPAWTRARARLGDKRWLVHESGWMNRRLGRADQVQVWLDAGERAGVTWVRPYHHGKDCIDAGGEGAYARLFADQAATMARDFWERDSERADGIFTFSARAAAHLRRVLGVPVVSIMELMS